MIPILLLWKVQTEFRQKLLLGVFLCLSICMIAVAIVRISGLRIQHTVIDVQWEAFWLEVEATIAVNVVSITAFRSVLGIKASQAREKNRSWYSHRRRHLSRKVSKGPENNPDTDELSSIPGVVLSDMRTVVRGDRDSGSIFREPAPRKSKDDWPLPEQNIKTAYKISYGSEIVRHHRLVSRILPYYSLLTSGAINYRRQILLPLQASFRPRKGKGVDSMQSKYEGLEKTGMRGTLVAILVQSLFSQPFCCTALPVL